MDNLSNAEEMRARLADMSAEEYAQLSVAQRLAMARLLREKEAREYAEAEPQRRAQRRALALKQLADAPRCGGLLTAEEGRDMGCLELQCFAPLICFGLPCLLGFACLRFCWRGCQCTRDDE
jgi:hypothetical protein